MRHVFLVFPLLFCACVTVGGPKRPSGADAVEALLKARGEAFSGEFKVSVPQTELRVWLDGFSITPAMGLPTWLAFSPQGRVATARGVVVLLESEVGPIQRAALAAGFSVTALHNHFLREAPKIVFMHIGGRGSVDELTDQAKRLLGAITELRRGKGLQSGPTHLVNGLDGPALENILGVKAKIVEGVVKFGIERLDVELTDHGYPVDAMIGFNTSMAFQGTMKKAAVAGAFAMLEGEAEGVVRALTDGGLEVVGMHNEMVG